MAASEIPNADQQEAWNDAAGRIWARNADALDRQLRPIGHAAMIAAQIKPGDSILDIGCGSGQTTVDIAGRAGADGWAHGLDISALLIAEAAKAAKAGVVVNVSFEVGDAQIAKLRRAAYDLVYSRFGVMFFDDSVAAFANMRSALKPGGRIAFCCWRDFVANPWMTLPLQAAARFLPGNDAPPTPDAAGPFAFADPKRVTDFLKRAGFRDVVIEPFDVQTGAGALDISVDLAMHMGALAMRMREAEASDELKAKIQCEVAAAMAQHVDADGNVRMDAAAWIVRAVN